MTLAVRRAALILGFAAAGQGVAEPEAIRSARDGACGAGECGAHEALGGEAAVLLQARGGRGPLAQGGAPPEEAAEASAEGSKASVAGESAPSAATAPHDSRPAPSFCQGGQLSNARIEGRLIAHADCRLTGVTVMGGIQAYGNLVVQGGYVDGAVALMQAGSAVFERAAQVTQGVTMEAGTGDLTISGRSRIGGVMMNSAGRLTITQATVDAVDCTASGMVSITQAVVTGDVNVNACMGGLFIGRSRLGGLAVSQLHDDVQLDGSRVLMDVAFGDGSGRFTISNSKVMGAINAAQHWGDLFMSNTQAAAGMSLEGVVGRIDLDRVEVMGDAVDIPFAQIGELSARNCSFTGAAVTVQEAASVAMISNSFRGSSLALNMVMGRVLLQDMAGASLNVTENYDVDVNLCNFGQALIVGNMGDVLIRNSTIRSLDCKNNGLPPRVDPGIGRIVQASGQCQAAR